MDKHKDLARGFIKGDRVAAEALWDELKNDLTSHGPPQKDTNGWKKVWTDWKAPIRKKLSHNKAEDISTGGGPFNKFVISATDDNVAKICGIYTVVEGIPNTLDFCTTETMNDENSSSNTLKVSQDLNKPSNATTPKRKRQVSVNDSLNDFMTQQNKSLEKVGKEMEGISDGSKKKVRVLKDVEHAIKKLQKSVDNIGNILIEKNEETQRHNFEIEKCRQEEILLKQKKLQLKEMKLQLLKDKQ